MLVLEIHDITIRARNAAGETEPLGPAAACFREGRLVFGTGAVDRAGSTGYHDTYWSRPDGQPAGPGFPVGETRAGLVHQHLRAILDYLGTGGPTLLALPGSCDRETTAHLLGIVAAGGLEVRGLVDGALAATHHALDPEGVGRVPTPRVVYLDLQRHRATATHFRVEHDGTQATVTRTAVHSADGFGTRSWERAVVDAAARRFVAETRFDPLLTAETERALHDALSHRLADPEDDPAELTLAGYAIRADRAFLAEALAGHWDRLEALIETPDATVLVSAHLGGMPGLACRFPEAEILPGDAGVNGTAALGPDPRIAEGISFRTRLTMTTRPPLDPAAATVPLVPHRRPTHILYRNRAYPMAPGTFSIGAAIDGAPDLELTEAAGRAELRIGRDLATITSLAGGTLNGERLDAPRVLAVGDAIALGVDRLTLIEVVP